MLDSPDGNTDSQECRWAALMVCAQAGMEADYQQLLGEVSVAIHRYLSSRFGHHHFIDDCVQDVLIAIHQARHTYDPQRLFRPWLFAIVRHKAVDTLRHHSRYKDAMQRQQTYDELFSAPNSAEQVEQNMDQGRLMNTLSPQYREVITLTKIVGLSTAETASQLSISKAAVKVRVHRAISHLRRLMEAETL